MKVTLLTYICCPNCGGSLEIREAVPEVHHILEGTLQCVRCSRVYPVHKGIPHLLVENESWASKAREAEGWVSLWDKKGMYKNPTLEDSFRLPYVGGIWTDVARMFDMVLREMTLTGEETILDLGAGQGWASRYFAEKGCEVVAVDIVADEWYGLGRSWAIMEHAGVYFEPVLADGEDIPLFPERFDIVFLCGALHHFEKFGRVLEQIYKVLKPGSLFIAAGEPSISIFTRERAVQAVLEETKAGITERRPKVFQYWWALRRAGFSNIRIDTFETYNASPSQIYGWVTAVRHNLYQAVRPRYKLLVWLAFSFILMLPYKWAGWFALQLNGGNLFMRAVKPMRR